MLRRKGLDEAELPGPRISPYPRPALARHRLPAEPLLGAVLGTGLGLPEVTSQTQRSLEPGLVPAELLFWDWPGLAATELVACLVWPELLQTTDS